MAFKTFQQLTVATDVQDGDLFATARGSGALTSATASVLVTYLTTKFPPIARTLTAAGLATGGGDFSASRTITVAEALAADVLTGTSTTKAMTPGDTYAAFAEVALTDAATIAVDMSTFLNAGVTLGGNRTLGNPTNTKVGQTGYIRLIQDATGSRTLSFASNWKRQGGAPTLTTTANAVDVLEYQVISSTYILYNVLLSPT